MALAVILQKAREFPSEVSGESSEKKAERARLASGEIIELSGYLSGDLSTAAQEFLQGNFSFLWNLKVISLTSTKKFLI